ncbi:methyltransferase, FxLD system [Streptomyces sp. NPDC017940]|uniref:methyltransferase, FxLD system n=1 Tax=Streptomyces sp. NPDC017940 TaxID=3365017 RepID=UPI0037B3C550
MTTTPTAANTSPEELRNRMVDRIRQAGHARDPRVEEAMRAVPRHAFVPDADLEDAYANKAVITKRAEDGKALSCASVPTVVAMMLDQLAVREGQSLLEIGAGTGYNAALLALLASKGERVVTIDHDEEVTAGARKNLDATGYHDVTVITRDGALGAPERAPYDGGIFTVGAWDLPWDLLNQFADGARLVVPLRWRGQTRSVAFVRDGNAWPSDSMELCGFVPMIGQEGEHTATLDEAGDVTLRWDADQDIAPARLRGILDQPKTVAWSGTTLGSNESFDGVWLRLTATETGTCGIAATRAAVEAGICTPATAVVQSPAIVDGDSLAYFTQRRLESEIPRWEFGAIGQGPDGEHLAQRLCERIREWGQDHEARPAIMLHPTGTPATALPHGLRITKEHLLLTLSLPSGK